MRNLSFLLPSLLLACTPTVETKTAIFLTMATDGDYTLQDYADFAYIVVDPVTGGFLTAEGIEPAEGAFSTGFGVETEFGNFDESDDELEMRVRMDLSKFGEEPVLEIGFSAQNQGPFNSLVSSMDGTIQYLEAPIYSPVSFVQDQIVTNTDLHSPRESSHGCNNEWMMTRMDGRTSMTQIVQKLLLKWAMEHECNDGVTTMTTVSWMPKTATVTQHWTIQR